MPSSKLQASTSFKQARQGTRVSSALLGTTFSQVYRCVFRNPNPGFLPVAASARRMRSHHAARLPTSVLSQRHEASWHRTPVQCACSRGSYWSAAVRCLPTVVVFPAHSCRYNETFQQNLRTCVERWNERQLPNGGAVPEMARCHVADHDDHTSIDRFFRVGQAKTLTRHVPRNASRSTFR